MERSYGQLCPAARALDLLGQRWTLLILRNLLVAPMRYGELLSSLPGVTTNLLALRLKELAQAGLLQRTDLYGIPEYELTPVGEETRAILYALAEYGNRLPPSSSAQAEVRPALLSLCRTRRPNFQGELELRIGDCRPLYLNACENSLRSSNLPSHHERVVLTISADDFLAAIFRGRRKSLRFVGDQKLARKWARLLAGANSN